MSPIGGLSCALREKWSEMFRNKAGGKIGQIQDVLQCCGYRGTRDMPFPFPSQERGVGIDECTRRFPERVGASCEEGWRSAERVVAGCVLGVAIGTFVWMVSEAACASIAMPDNMVEFARHANGTIVRR